MIDRMMPNPINQIHTVPRAIGRELIFAHTEEAMFSMSSCWKVATIDPWYEVPDTWLFANESIIAISSWP